MKSRMNYYQYLPASFGKLADIGNDLKESSLGNFIPHIIKIRASQMNGCAFCIDMHVKEAKLAGERELRLHHIAAWRDSPLFDAREKAALLWTEAVTKISPESVSDTIYQEVKAHFNEKEIVELTMFIAVINAWNRFAISFHTVPGSSDKAFGLDKAGLV